MVKHIALLRAVNVGGTGKVKMAELREMAEAMGFTEVETLLQSGNLVFAAKGKDENLEGRLEAELEAKLKVKAAVMVRSATAWREIIEANPFPKAAHADPSHLLVAPLKAKPATGAEAALQVAIRGPETAKVVGEAAYIVYPDGIGRSKLTSAVIEAKLGVKATGRNWNTVLKLAEMAGA
jgi:uncharacterized protein (DUF1697 family)